MNRFKKLWYSIVARGLISEYHLFIHQAKLYEESLTEEIDELENDIEKMRKEIQRYRCHPRGLGNGIWFVGDNIVSNIRGEFNDFYHKWARVRQGEFDFGE